MCISLIFFSEIFTSEFWSTSVPCTDQTVLQLKDRIKQTALINAAFYAINWFHNLAGIKSPTLHPAVIAVKEGAVRLSAKEINRKEPLETDHLKSLASQINF